MPALFRWPCNISIHLSPRSVAAFLFICLPGLSLVVSTPFCWPCSISIHLSPRSIAGVVRPFPLAMQHFYSFVSQVCHWWCQSFPLLLFICLPCLSLLVSALFRCPRSISFQLSPRLVTGGVRPFPLFLFICLPGLSLLVSTLFRWPCSISIHLSPRSAFLFICLPGLSLLVSALFRWRCNISIYLSPMFVTCGVRPFPLAMQHFY